MLRPLGGSVHAVTTPRFTHCSELYGPSTSAVVNATQAYIKGIVRQWAAQGPYAGRHGGTLHAGTVAGSH